METHRILVVDDEVKMRRLLEMSLKNMGHEVIMAADGVEALARCEEAPFDLILTDLKMPRMDGLRLLGTLRERGEDVPVIVLTAFGTIETAVEAMKLGASDYIIRPFEMETVELAVTRALAMGAVQRENRYLRDEMAKGWGEFIGRSPKMRQLYELIQQVAPARSNVLIVGETGTGKELVARAIHQASGRNGLFVPINCAAIPADLLESELFGHQKGAFTGAHRDRMGKFELASGGTVFLDEITEMSMNLQAKLLRVLQEGSVERLGAQRAVKVDLRIVAATNRNLQQAVDEGVMRQDLFFRLNVVRVDVPPLRERREDIQLLAEHFLHKYSSELGRPVPVLSEAALCSLLEYDWPGNVRELENLMERAAVLCRGNTVEPHALPLGVVRGEVASPAPSITLDSAEPESLLLRDHVEAVEKRLIRAALQRSGDNKSAASRLLGVSERALWYKIKKYGF
ncbi:MAG: sigma-54 dependent transcriptional regulator [Gammaproteobacteria bacterium]|jgi:two-component system response regulator AtoC